MPLLILLSALVELWPASVGGYYQHAMRGEVRVATTGVVRVEGWMGLGWWGRPDAKIRGSVLNLEATRALERTYGARVLVGTWYGVGVSASRRGVDELDRVRVWGQPVTVEDAPYSIGYHDGARLVGWIGPVMVESPYVVQWHGCTLPWHDWRVIGAYGPVDADVRFGGPRDGVMIDVGVTIPVTDRLGVGWRVGTVALPGWGRDQFRAALTLGVRA